MGEILLAEDIRLKRNVAIKSICRESLADPDSRSTIPPRSADRIEA